MFTSRLSKKISVALDQLLPAVPGAALGVAVSGGPDSVALLTVLVSLIPARGLNLHVLHVNHGLRSEADAEQSFVEALCQQWQVPCTVERLVPPTKRTGIEAWARESRYQFFRRLRDALGLAAVALAHTRDDQAETVLFRFLRGSARRGLAGIPPLRDGWIIRPMLDCSRRDVMQFLSARQLSFMTDSSNTDLRHTRNKIRHQLLPLLEREFSPRVREHLVNMATVLREEEGWLEQMTTAARARVQESPVALSLPQLAHEPEGLQTRILRQWVESDPAVRDVSFSHLGGLRALASGRRRSVVDLPGGMSVRREEQQLVLEKKSSVARRKLTGPQYNYPLRPGEELDVPEGGWRVSMSSPSAWDDRTNSARSSDLWQALFDLDACHDQILVRNYRPGDRIAPLGLGGQKKVHDVFIDAKVPCMLRRSLPLIQVGDLIAWIPGCVRGEVAKISATTRRVCRVTVIPLPEK
jgi:tRNA(Ile)-lysidine synthase